jgi:hypothetical protein
MTEGNAEPTPRVCGVGYPALVMQTFCITI